jgi:drug/metabolite transporter (DMT)-like permease
MKALKSSDLSISVPMLAFTPLFLLITSPFIVGEFPDIFGLIGVLLIVVGSYVLNIKEFAGGWLSPFRVLLKERGPQLMLIVAFLWSITSNFDKVGVQNSSPFFWALIINLFIAVALFPILILRSSEPGNFKKNLDKLIPVGLFSAITIIFQMTAINLTLVAYVIAIKRTSIIFSVLWGHYIFKEEGVRERLIGVMIMILGAFFITISSLS